MARLCVFALVSMTFVTTGVEASALEECDFPTGPGHAIDHALSGVVTPRVQNEILVLGSTHLAAFADRLEPEHLENTLALLESVAPTSIAIERLTADEIALLGERAAHDPAADTVVEMFARTALEHGRTMQQAFDVDRVVAAQRADDMLSSGISAGATDKRLMLIGYLLAAYEYDTATLHWSYLSPEARAGTTALPAGIRASLNRYLESANEIVTVAMPLARRLGLQRLLPIDSHYEAVRTLSYPQASLEAVFAHPAFAEMRESEAYKRVEGAPEAALESGDLRQLYRYLNTHQGQVDHAQEWAVWLGMDHDSGLDRFRYAMWELRNQRMAVNILNAVASPESKRLLVIVGAGHKAFLDRALRSNLSVRLIQLEDFEAHATDRRLRSR